MYGQVLWVGNIFTRSCGEVVWDYALVVHVCYHRSHPYYLPYSGALWPDAISGHNPPIRGGRGARVCRYVTERRAASRRRQRFCIRRPICAICRPHCSPQSAPLIGTAPDVCSRHDRPPRSVQEITTAGRTGATHPARAAELEPPAATPIRPPLVAAVRTARHRH